MLRRTLLPQDDEPYARRLFADLASGVIYVVAFVGVMDSVFEIQMSAVLATSGVLAIVLGLAFQSTLGDVLSGLAINIDRPFGAGVWIAVAPDIEGEVVQINWRATRPSTWLGALVVIPNSVIARSVVANHSRLARLHRCVFHLHIEHAYAPERVLALQADGMPVGTLVSDLRLVATPADRAPAAGAAIGANPAVGTDPAA